MNLAHLRYFVKLAHTRHYTKAAEQLYITQPSLSHAMLKLEAELGVDLFDKAASGLELTQLGEHFLSDVEEALAILDSSVDYLKRSALGDGVVRLGMLRVLGVEYAPKLIRSFLDENSGKQIDFTIFTGVTHDLLDKLKRRELDIVLSSKAPDAYKLRCEPFYRQDLVLIVPENHRLGRQHTVDLADTVNEPFIRFSEGSGLRYVVDELYAQVGAHPPVAYEIQEDSVIASMVANGFGIAVVPYMELLLRLGVNILQISKPRPDRRFYLVSDPSVTLSPAAQSFHDYILAHSQL